MMQNHEKMILLQDASAKNRVTGSVKCQMVRSASSWSVGCKEVNKEMSIQLAYIQLIGEAKHFIYIENQFFISNSAGHPVENGIAEALVKRIKDAARKKEKFKVVVFVPLLPGFEGEIDDSNSAIMKVQLHWEYFTISRGGNSILEQLIADPFISDPSEYIEFFSLRQHAISPETKEPVTELIYIHSKLIIVDDEIVLMGSANINDRSLQGKRDSEIAMVVEDEEKK
jgi:phospholipase D1/2